MRWTARTIAAVGRTLAVTAIVTAVVGIIWLGLVAPERMLNDLVLPLAIFGVGFGLITWLVMPAQPRNRAVWAVCVAALASGLYSLLDALFFQQLVWLGVGFDTATLTPASLPTTVTVPYQLSVGVAPAGLLAFTLGLLLFPDGHPPSPRWRWAGWLALASLGTVGIRYAWAARPTSTTPYDTLLGALGPFTDLGFVVLVAALGAVLSMLLSLAAMIVRFRRSRGLERQQFRWVMWGAAMSIAIIVSGLAGSLFFDVGPITFGYLISISWIIPVVSYGFAIGRYGLYHVHTVISRTVVYGTLAGFIGAVYVLFVVVLGDLIGSRTGGLALPVMATAVVAVAFEPVRLKAQRWANRLVYGQRASPYEILSDLTKRLGGTEPTEGVLTRMAELMAEGTGAERATVWLAGEQGRLTAAAVSPNLETDDRVESIDHLAGTVAPVVHDGQLVGALQVVTSRGNPITPSEKRLLDDLAGSAGMVLGNQRLNARLKARAAELLVSRRRLVQVQDRERRRLERDLHDGAQQQIVALKVKLGLAERVTRKRNSVHLADKLSQIGDRVQGVLDEVRTIARGIYPPLLESDGLESALRSLASTSTCNVEIDTTGVERYTKDVESAVYFAVVEAVGQLARAGVPSHVHVSVTDDAESLGLELNLVGGELEIGDRELVGVRDRIDALGGTFRVGTTEDGTITMSGRIPLDQRESPSKKGSESRLVGVDPR